MTISEEYLQPGSFIDSDAAAVVDFAHDGIGGLRDETERVIALYQKVRDSIDYDPYIDYANPAFYRASSVLELGRGYCVSKAAVLAAAVRAIGTPARVGYASVRNHLTSPRLYEKLQTDIYRWHSYTDVFLDGRWVKATPVFNVQLCRKLGIEPLEFDGRSDSLFQEYDPIGRRYMEYLDHHGTFADVPFETIVNDFRIHYPALMQGGMSGDFQSEAVSGDLP